ncbi:hypothetical protein PF010_g42 [Phytophthora fragariae]|uniref:Uncharacterized protein n=2 Tax=Phytophthora fragariae TaxID=53985 RepID=A0A6A3UVD6_9STRA|nr:hypothetical protein PF010_g42 [Phytophthora fragariae]KAE9156017.1 hypothetical protein PF006_g91 [Phytophthora fragariae]KAE9256596.1 hypothetical protein PF004_g43 [Phytophthora fragariae]
MPPSRSGSMIPPQRRSRSASMSSLAQVDLNTLDTELVLDYARKVMHLQLLPATSPEKMEMLFALSQKLLKWLLEDRDQSQKQLEKERRNLLHSTPSCRADAAIRPLNIQKLLPEASPPKKIDTPSVASRILASAVAPMSSTCSVEPMIPLDVKLATTSTAPTQIQYIDDSSAIRAPEAAMMPIGLNQRGSLQSVRENEPFTESVSNLVVSATQQVQAPQEPVPFFPPKKPDALEVYLQVQRSVICMQKYVRGFMARRRFFRALEELLQGRA